LDTFQQHIFPLTFRIAANFLSMATALFHLTLTLLIENLFRDTE